MDKLAYRILEKQARYGTEGFVKLAAISPAALAGLKKLYNPKQYNTGSIFKAIKSPGKWLGKGLDAAKRFGANRWQDLKLTGMAMNDPGMLSGKTLGRRILFDWGKAQAKTNPAGLKGFFSRYRDLANKAGNTKAREVWKSLGRTGLTLGGLALGGTQLAGWAADAANADAGVGAGRPEFTPGGARDAYQDAKSKGGSMIDSTRDILYGGK